MASEVYFTKAGAAHFTDSILTRLEKLFDRAGAGSIIKQDELVAVKTHFGEPGNVTFIPPVYAGRITERIKICGGRPFITDTNTLYVGGRSNSADHTVSAMKNGFSYSTIGAPIVISDGLLGGDYVDVEIGLENIKKAKIASGIYWADSMIVLSHVKMHLNTSLGAALKNLGMGCASRGGKQEQHSGNVPGIKKENCTACSECVSWCSFEAITVEDTVKIDEDKCAGCGECIAVCRFDALECRWDGGSEKLQEKMAEYAFAAVKNKKGKVFYFNFLLNITPDCDCLPSSGKIITPDIGILASFDPVAIDAASADLIKKAAVIEENVKDRSGSDMNYAGKDNFKLVWPNLDHNVQLDYAEKIGLGSKDYELVEE
ncbi:MAG TPA: DUF362 domain-containing protein [Firmicutes bacterium]|nr:DUF362 domain-containing protein [Bacillota bacterium]